jgi:dienelactone hydrolase
MAKRIAVVFWRTWVVLAVMCALVGGALAQGQRPTRAQRGQLKNQGGVPLKKARPDAADQLAKAAVAPARPPLGTFHYLLRIRSFDGAPLAATYYPTKLGSAGPVVMLIHEIGRSRKDFDDAVLDLKGQGLAEHLQGLGYAVFSVDQRGQGQNPRGQRQSNQQLVEDLQAGYFFLVDRHNRGDFNLAKLGVIAVGDGANLVAAWASQSGAAVTTEGRASDLSALVLVSPKPDGYGYVFGHALGGIGPRVPFLLLAGEKDAPSKDAVQSARQIAQRSRLNKIELFPSSLHGYKFLRLEPKVTTTIFQFLDTTLKNRPVEWEPQYNLTPITYGEPQIVLNSKATDARKDQPKAKQAEKDAAPAPKPKAEADPGDAKDAPAKAKSDAPPTDEKPN